MQQRRQLLRVFVSGYPRSTDIDMSGIDPWGIGCAFHIQPLSKEILWKETSLSPMLEDLVKNSHIGDVRFCFGMSGFENKIYDIFGIFVRYALKFDFLIFCNSVVMIFWMEDQISSMMSLN